MNTLNPGTSPNRLSPEEISVILDSIADGVFTVDCDFIITSFNRSAELITGFTATEAVGQQCHNIFRTSVCQTDCMLGESMRTGRRISGQEVTILNRMNEEIPISVSTAILRNKNGDVIGGVETFRDLTAVEQLRQEIARKYTLHDMVSKNHRMQQIFALVSDVAASKASVMIQGETGTGKGLLARAIHNESPRREAPFVEVNCGSLPDTLLESELFGHVAGAFTDARIARKGRFELADGGTVFLDEIGDTSQALQVKLLHVLQEGTFEPVGSSKTHKTDVRVITATHRDMKELVAGEAFRSDLYYRINTVQLILPPLRERREDIPLLVDHFIERFNRLTEKHVRNVSGNAMRALLHYPWPGNVRELEHAIEHAFVLAKEATLGVHHFPVELTSTVDPKTSGRGKEETTPTILKDAERRAIEEVLRKHAWNKAAASLELGMSRTTLWRKMRKLGIRPE